MEPQTVTPTVSRPPMGPGCRACGGRGRVVTAPVADLPIGSTQEALEFWAPACDGCGGSGREPRR